MNFSETLIDSFSTSLLFPPLDKMSFFCWPGDGNSYTLCLLQQPHGVSGSCEDQKGAGCHSHDGSHQHGSCADHYHPVQPGGGCILWKKLYLLMLSYWCTELSAFLSLSADFTEGHPHWPNTGQDPTHPDYNPREVHPVKVQPSHQDTPPVSYVPVCCHAARRSQLAVSQHYGGTGARNRRGTVNPFTIIFPRIYRLKTPLCTLWSSSSPMTLGIWRIFSLLCCFIVAILQGCRDT